MKIVGIVVALVGVWFGAAGGFGEARLRVWETSLRDWIHSRSIFQTAFSGANWVYRHSQGARKEVMSSFGRLVWTIAWILVILSGVGAIGAGISSGNAMLAGVVAVSALVVFLFVLPVTVYILAALFALVVWLIALPYLLVEKFTSRIRYQSTLLFLGAVFSTIGILITALG